MSSDLPFLDLVDVAEAIRRGEASSVDVAKACVNRIQSHQSTLNCFIELEVSEALAAAAEADAAMARGEPLGPLHGVPLAHKDLYYRAGKNCTCGTSMRRDFKADRTATTLIRLKDAGALHLGSLNMSEFAIGPTGHNATFGHCRNPWNPAHIAGGSSSGCGTAVAARLIYGALGSDTGGSIRTPSALCGLVGLKPTHGRVSRYGVMPVSFSTDCFGPMTRSVRDCARLTRVIAGHDPMDPTSHRHPVDDYERACGSDIRHLRIGRCDVYADIEVTPDVWQAMNESLKTYENLGAEIVEIDLPNLMQLNQMSEIVTRCEAATVHRIGLRENWDDYDPQLRRRLTTGLSIPASWYIDALSARGVLLQEFSEAVFSHCDVLMLPTVGSVSPTIDETDVGDSDQLPSVLTQMTGLTRPINYLGLPALAMPAGFNASGLPVSFQLVGLPFAESTLFATGHAYQQATDWHTRAPSFTPPDNSGDLAQSTA